MDPTLDRERWWHLSAILDGALDLPPEARPQYLTDACGGDDGLRREVDELLATAADGGSFLLVPAVERAAPLVAEITRERALPSPDGVRGRAVGAYRLVRELGEGGMGLVCLAERVDGQFEQHVAIKLLKRGLHGEEARRRFLQERQILARLEHPAIARLLDGGVTDDGIPFFVMEHVQGRPVTIFCSERGLGVDDRLRIFLQICDAVQYAHRNLIVHRDLKPSNILIDDAGRVKLLDFGIAKVLGDGESAPGAVQTIVRALTPEYAAPEQLRGEPVNTSTDVYALGVLLYELLTGMRPYAVPGAAIGEIERAILEQDPVPPSSLMALGRERRKLLRGDLDRIVVKALQNSPERRYPSAEALATDVQRHLDGLPVSAHGDALSYRAGKFLRRHRVGVGAAALLLLSLIGGLIGTTWQARRAEREARKAGAVKEFMKTLFSAADPAQAMGREPSVRQLLDAGALRIETELQDQPDVQSEVARLVAAVYHELGEYERAVPLLRADLERRRRIDGPRSIAVAELLTQIADTRYEQSRFDDAGAMYAEALAIQREKRGERSPQVAELLWDIAGVARNRGDLAGAEALEKQSLAIYVQTEGDDSADAAAVRESLAITYNQGARFAEAAALQEPVAAFRERHLGADHPNTLIARYNLAYYMQALGRFNDAVRIAEDVVARQRRVIGERHDRLAATLRLLARALDSAGRAEDALSPIAEALSIHAERFGLVHFQAATDRVWQAQIEAHTGRLAEAERDGREALSFFDAQTGAVRADVPSMRACIGAVLAEAGRLEDADAQISRAVSDLRTAHQDGPFLGLALDALGDVARQRQQMSHAVELTREALTVLERDLGADHPATAVARVHAGAAQWGHGQTVSAEPLMRAGLDELARQFPAGHPDLAGAQFLFGRALQQSGRSVEARPFLQSAFNWRRTHFGEKDYRTMAVRHALDASRNHVGRSYSGEPRGSYPREPSRFWPARTFKVLIRQNLKVPFRAR